MKEYQTDRKFLVVGVGGLGCFIVEGLIRMNVKKIVICDKDTFSTSNLNRQLYATPSNIGEYKVDVALKRAKELNYQGEIIAYKTEYSKLYLEDIDIVIDALDNIDTRLILEDDCANRNIPIIHGAVEDNIYQIGICMPHKNTLHNIYANIKEPKEKHTNYITVSSCAARQLDLALGEIKDYFEIVEI